MVSTYYYCGIRCRRGSDFRCLFSDYRNKDYVESCRTSDCDFTVEEVRHYLIPFSCLCGVLKVPEKPYARLDPWKPDNLLWDGRVFALKRMTTKPVGPSQTTLDSYSGYSEVFNRSKHVLARHREWYDEIHAEELRKKYGLPKEWPFD